MDSGSLNMDSSNCSGMLAALKKGFAKSIKIAQRGTELDVAGI